MSQVKFNINEHVRVKLTPAGLKVLNDHWAEFGVLDKLDRLEVDDQGFTEFQLWDLMSIFGSSICIGSKTMFETDIYFDSKDLEEVDGNVARAVCSD